MPKQAVRECVPTLMSDPEKGRSESNPPQAPPPLLGQGDRNKGRRGWEKIKEQVAMSLLGIWLRLGAGPIVKANQL